MNEQRHVFGFSFSIGGLNNENAIWNHPRFLKCQKIRVRETVGKEIETNLPIQSHPSADAAYDNDGKMIARIASNHRVVLIRRENWADDLFSRSGRRRLSKVTQIDIGLFKSAPNIFFLSMITKYQTRFFVSKK